MHLHSIPACHKWLCLPFLPQRITAPPLVATARAAAAPCLCTSAGACSRRVATPHLAATIPPSARAAALMAHQLRSSPSARKEVGARPFCLSLLPLLLRMLVGSAASYPCSSSCHSPPCPPPPTHLQAGTATTTPAQRIPGSASAAAAWAPPAPTQAAPTPCPLTPPPARSTHSGAARARMARRSTTTAWRIQRPAWTPAPCLRGPSSAARMGKATWCMTTVLSSQRPAR